MNVISIAQNQRSTPDKRYAELTSIAPTTFFPSVDAIRNKQRHEQPSLGSVWYINLKDKVSGFANLQANWDSYNADPISMNGISTAIQVLGQLRYSPFFSSDIIVTAFPMRDGGVQLEFDGENLSAELEINPRGEPLLLFFDNAGNLFDRIEFFELSEITTLIEDAQYAAI